MRRGLGVVVNPDGSYYVPGWCTWLPFSSFNDACKLPTPAQAQADQMSNLGPAARSNPELVKKLQEQWATADSVMCAENPEDCAAYQFAIENPDFSAAFGVGPVARGAASIGKNLPTLTGVPSWIWPAVLGLGLLLVLRSER